MNRTNRNFLSRGLTPLVLVLMAGLGVGCSSQERNPYENQDDDLGTPRSRPQLTADEANKGYTVERHAYDRATVTTTGERRETAYQTSSSGTTTMFFPSGTRDGSILMVERTAPAEVIVGAPFHYTMRVTNLTNNTLNNVFVRETSDSNFEVTASNPQPTHSRAGMEGEEGLKGRDAMNWKIGSLGPRESRVIEIDARTDQAGPATSCIWAGASPAVCVTMNAVAAPTVTLALSGPREVLICEDVPLRFTVTNTGQSTARNLKLRAPFPEGWHAKSGTAEVNIGDLAPGQTKTVDVLARADRPGDYTSAAEVTGDMGVSARADAASVTVIQPELRVDFDAPQTTYLGRDMGSKITITNPTNTALRDVRITADFPGARFDQDNQRGNNTWNIGNLGPGETKTAMVRLSGDQVGEVRGRIRAEAYCAQPQVQEFTTRVVGIPALLLEVVDERDPVRIGDETVYTIRVTNQGSANATNIKILGVLPNGEQFVAARGFGDTTAGEGGGANVQFTPLATLAPKATAEWQIRVKATAPGDVRFGVRMTADQLESPVEETESTNLVE